MLNGSKRSPSPLSQNLLEELISLFRKKLRLSDGSAIPTHSTLSSPFDCTELTLHVLKSLPTEEKNYLPLRLVSKQWKKLTEQDVYLELLNTQEVMEETHQPVVSNADKEALYQKQQLEIDHFVQHQTAICTKFPSPEISQALAKVMILSHCPYTAFDLYQRHKALEKLNLLLIQAKIDPLKQVLICSQCFLTRFPAKLLRSSTFSSFFSNLKTINISNNCLTSIPSAIFQLPYIERVLASHNEIKTVDITPSPSQTLSWVDLHANQLREFPEILLGSIKLNYLNLAYNYLLDVPETLWGKKLTIDINHNCLTDIDARCPNRKMVLKTQTTLDQALTDDKQSKRRCSVQ